MPSQRDSFLSFRHLLGPGTSAFPGLTPLRVSSLVPPVLPPHSHPLTSRSLWCLLSAPQPSLGRSPGSWGREYRQSPPTWTLSQPPFACRTHPKLLILSCHPSLWPFIQLLYFPSCCSQSQPHHVRFLRRASPVSTGTWPVLSPVPGCHVGASESASGVPRAKLPAEAPPHHHHTEAPPPPHHHFCSDSHVCPSAPSLAAGRAAHTLLGQAGRAAPLGPSAGCRAAGHGALLESAPSD